MAHARVWDLPVRIFHWSMVILLCLLWWSAESGEMQWHQVFAYSLMTMVLFRILWGFVGSETARFQHFLKHPFVVFQYAKSILKEGIKGHRGHNPLGGYMVMLLLLILATQLMTGLFASDDVFTEGPLASLASAKTVDWMTWIHKCNFTLILILGSVHVLAVAMHVFKGDSLLGAMFTGRRAIPDTGKDDALEFVSPWKALWLYVMVALPVAYLLLWPAIRGL